MSRHRLVRNLVDDDYYDDYDDDYYDDYEEEEDYGSTQQQYAPPTRTQQHVPRPTSTTTAPAKAQPATGVTKPPPGWGKPTNPTVGGGASGVAKPPPGWGKPNNGGLPATSSAKSSSMQASAGVTKPPPGWGKPNNGSSVSSSSLAQASAGVTKPPPGWGKPTSSGKVEISSASSGSGITKPPDGWGKPNETKSATGLTSPAPTAKNSSAAGSSTSRPRSKSPKQQKQNVKKPLPDFLKNSSNNKSQLSMVVIGHVDAGKSTLMGQVLVQVGQVTKRAATKQGQLAWLLDEEESERQRGVTMQIATKTIATPNHDIVMLDAPGHADFIPIMITGAAHADVAILVVAATRGEFEAGFDRGGQTKEHVILARGLGVSQVIVAINKLDIDEWDQGRYQEIQHKVKEYLLQQQFKSNRIRFVPVSGLTGENVKQVSQAASQKLHSWYKGPTLLEAINSFQPAKRNIEKPLRFVLSDVYAEGRGVIARGRVAQGFLRVDERLCVYPIGDTTTVSKLEHLQPPTFTEDVGLDVQQQRLSVGLAGDTVELLLTGIDIMRITPGNLLTNANSPPPICKRARAKILVMEDLNIPIIRGAQVLFHMHSLDVPAVVNKLIAITKRDGSIKKERPRALTGGASATVEVTLNDRICMEPFSECRALGRFVLRRSGDTIAVGIIEELL